MALTDESTSTSSGPSASSVAGALGALSSASSSIKNAWENSGAKDVFANAQSNLPQGTQDTLSIVKQNIFNRKNIRTPTVFFGMGEEQPFYVEKVPSLVTERVRHNFRFFYLNYAMVTTVLFCLTLLISPSAIIGIGLLGFAWVAVIRATSEGSVQIKGTIGAFLCVGWILVTDYITNCYYSPSQLLCYKLLLLTLPMHPHIKQESPSPKNKHP